jgi:hypothetical protein
LLLVNHEVINIMIPIGSGVICIRLIFTCHLLFFIRMWLRVPGYTQSGNVHYVIGLLLHLPGGDASSPIWRWSISALAIP